jgi:hypothetical protein
MKEKMVDKLKLSEVKIFPRVAVHTKKLTLNGTFTFHILLHGKKEASTSIPKKESMQKKKDITSKICH